MKRLLAVFFSAALLSSIFAPMAGATSSPSTQFANGNGYGCSNSPVNDTHNTNNGNHSGTNYYCYY